MKVSSSRRIYVDLSAGRGYHNIKNAGETLQVKDIVGEHEAF